jgi:hypothetical protein
MRSIGGSVPDQPTFADCTVAASWACRLLGDYRRRDALHGAINEVARWCETRLGDDTQAGRRQTETAGGVAYVIAPDCFQYGHERVDGLTRLEWKLFQVMCENGQLRQAVPLAEAVGHVYGIDPKNGQAIGEKTRTFMERRRGAQQKLDAKEMRLMFDLTNGFLSLKPF